MTRRSPSRWMIILLGLAGAMTAAGNRIDLRDDTGFLVSLAGAPERIISLTPSGTEILYALGLEHRVVGVTNYCDYPPSAAGKTRIGDLNLDYEKIISLYPDLLVAVGNMPNQSVARLRALGLPAAVFSPADLASVMDTVMGLGRLTGRPAEARRLVEEMRCRQAAVENRLAGLRAEDKPRVFVEIWPEPVMTAGPGTFTGELIGLAGGVDIAYDAKPWSAFSQELVLTRNPQVIISQCQSAARIGKRPAWSGLDAVRHGRVHDVDQDIFSRPGPRLVEALAILARLLHPGRFE